MNSESEARQLGLRLQGELLADVTECSETLGLDISTFVRMVLIENIARYKKRAERIRKGEEPTQD